MEILSWLPAKALVRFKCVCKRWFHLLTFDSHFITLHCNRSSKSQNPSFILKNYVDGTRKEDGIYFVPDYDAFNDLKMLEFPHINYKFVGSCNGLFCSSDARKNNVYIWNPNNIQNYLTIPFPSLPSDTNNKKFYFYFVFGFSQETDEYKIIAEYFVEDVLHLSVYTLRKNSCWRSMGAITYLFANYNRNLAFVNGSLHWKGCHHKKVDSAVVWSLIVGFDLKNELLFEIQPSWDIDTNQIKSSDQKVGELGGSLCVYDTFREVEEVHIWVMKEYGVVNSWSKHYIIGKPQVTDPLRYNVFDPLCIVKSGEILINVGWQYQYLYNPKRNEGKEFTRFE